MADLTLREIPAGGSAAANWFVAAAASQTVPAKVSSVDMAGYELESVYLLVQNTDAATRTVTVGSQAGVVVNATTGFAIIPVKSPGRNHGQIPITYSATANVTVALVRVSKS